MRSAEFLKISTKARLSIILLYFHNIVFQSTILKSTFVIPFGMLLKKPIFGSRSRGSIFGRDPLWELTFN